MNGLPNELLEELKTKLKTEEEALNLRISELAAQDPFADPEHSNDNAASDREASEEDGHDRITAMTDELKIQLEAIQTALSRIEDGTYGTCGVCEKPIDPARLKIMPTATTCVDHQK